MHCDKDLPTCIVACQSKIVRFKDLPLGSPASFSPGWGATHPAWQCFETRSKCGKLQWVPSETRWNAQWKDWLKQAGIGHVFFPLQFLMIKRCRRQNACRQKCYRHRCFFWDPLRSVHGLTFETASEILRVHTECFDINRCSNWTKKRLEYWISL